jgi:putative ABC transport system ATP-binding protein
MIQVKNLVKKFKSGAGEITVLKGLDFSVSLGEFVSVTGRSGSGKSTLLYQLGLLDVPTSGLIVIDGVDIGSLSKDESTQFRLNYLGYIFQDYAILPSLTALENVMVALLMQGIEESHARGLSQKALERVGLGTKSSNLPSQLSGGEQQRVSIARAIAHNPKIIFADEPTANLDSETSENILNAFLDLHRGGQTIVMVTHEPEYAKLTDRTVHLSDGVIVDEKINKKKL